MLLNNLRESFSGWGDSMNIVISMHQIIGVLCIIAGISLSGKFFMDYTVVFIEKIAAIDSLYGFLSGLLIIFPSALILSAIVLCISMLLCIFGAIMLDAFEIKDEG